MYSYKSLLTFVCVCAHLLSPRKTCHSCISYSLSVVRLWMGGLNLQIAAESHHISVIHVYDTDGGGGGIAAQQREKQTGLQGDQEDFWDWNQCAYYETGRLNRLGWAKSLIEHSNHWQIANLLLCVQTLCIMYTHVSHIHSQRQVKTQLVSAGKGKSEPKLNEDKLCRFVLFTCGRINSPLNQVVILVNPFAIALEVDLCGRGGAAGQRHRLVLYNVLILRLHQEVR